MNRVERYLVSPRHLFSEQRWVETGLHPETDQCTFHRVAVNPPVAVLIPRQPGNLNAACQSDASARQDHNSAKAALAKQGIQWSAPSPTEFAEWNRLASEANEQLVASGYISRPTYDRTMTLLNEFRAGAR